MLTDYLVYDESSPTCLRWLVHVKGSGPGKPKFPGDVAGKFYGRYAQLCLKGIKYYVHRLIWEMHCGNLENMDVDHFDKNPKNNKISNLRLMPHRFNQRNLTLSKKNTSGITGVRYERTKHRWQAKWVDLSGKEKSKSFSIRKFGDAAKTLAVEYRNSMIIELNILGAGYTASHGH